MSAIQQSDWQWFGDPGHFIGGRWCRFHLCTLIGKYLVSTVGAYVHPMHSGGSERIEAAWLADNWPGDDIGCDRKYETMVFRAGERCNNEGCNCGMPQITGSELDFRGYNAPGDAAAGHMELCHNVATEAFQGRKSTAEQAATCQSCNAMDGTSLHECPFKSEIHGDDTECNCCDGCQHECAMNI